MEPVLILSADQWELTDETTGEVRRGVTVYFVNAYRESTSKSIGLRPTKVPAMLDVFDSIRKGGAPGIYFLDFRTRPGKEGKPVLTATQARLDRKLDLFSNDGPTTADRKTR